MTKFAFFSIPAYGHTNPTLPVVEELVRRHHEVVFFSFAPFQNAIEKTGAKFVSLDAFLGMSQEKAQTLKRSSTDMFCEDIDMTIKMHDFLAGQLQAFAPDLIVSDSVCFWGKLLARHLDIPLAVSTTTFAFNRFSSKAIKMDGREMLDNLLGIPRMKKALKKLRPLGYSISNPLELISTRDEDWNLVYTSDLLQPCAETFGQTTCFAGPNPIFSKEDGADSGGQASNPQEQVLIQKLEQKQEHRRKRIYVSLGTVVSDDASKWKDIVSALKKVDADVLISSPIPLEGAENFTVMPFVDQVKELSQSDLFVTHAGMNSANEALYMGVPMILLPQTGEQRAVASQVERIGCGKTGLEHLSEVLDSSAIHEKSREISRQLRLENAPKKAADFLERAAASQSGK